MAKAKTTAKKTTSKKSTSKKKSTTSRKQYEAQAYIGRLSDKATEIQKAGGTRTITKTVYKVNRADAVKKAAKSVK